MRDPKAHAKILANRAQAAERAWADAFDQGDHRRCRHIEMLIARLEKLSELNYICTGWQYVIEGDGTAYWRHLEYIPDTEEEAS